MHDSTDASDVFGAETTDTGRAARRHTSNVGDVLYGLVVLTQMNTIPVGISCG